MCSLFTKRLARETRTNTADGRESLRRGPVSGDGKSINQKTVLHSNKTCVHFLFYFTFTAFQTSGPPSSLFRTISGRVYGSREIQLRSLALDWHFPVSRENSRGFGGNVEDVSALRVHHNRLENPPPMTPIFPTPEGSRILHMMCSYAEC